MKLEPGDKLRVTTRDGLFARPQWLKWDGERWWGECGSDDYTPSYFGRWLWAESERRLGMFPIFHMAEQLIAEGSMEVPDGLD